MLLSRSSNLPFLDGADDMYRTINNSHFKLVEHSAMPKKIVFQPASPHFQRGDQKCLGNYETETALSFPSHPPIPVTQPKLTHFEMQSTNFKMHSEDRCGRFETTQSDFKPMPRAAAQLIRPTTAVKTSVTENKRPETTYNSCYTKHEPSPIIKTKETTNRGVGSTLRQDKKDNFSSSYREQFEYRWCPTTPLQSTEKQRIQYSSVAMGDREKIMDKLTTYSTSFRECDVHSSAKFRVCLRPETDKSGHIILQELPDDKWSTTSSDEFCAHKFCPVRLEHRNPTLSSVFKGEMLNANQERFSTINQCFFPKINSTQFPVHVDGPSIRTLSNVKFGRPNLAGRFYTTTTQEQFPPKEAVRPKPLVYPSSHVLFEQEIDGMLTTMQKDFVSRPSRRQKISPTQVQQVKESHIRP